MKKNSVFSLLLLFSLILIVLNDLIDMRLLREICIYPVRPFQNASDFISDVLSAQKFSSEILSSYTENSLKYRSNEAYMTENAELRKMLGLLSRGSFEMTAAEVSGGDFSGYTKLLVNKGKADGVEIQMAVVFLNGIVGKITDAGEHYSEVQTMRDINFKIGVTDKERKNFLIAQYYRSGLLITYDMSRNIEFHTGDTLYSSGIGGVFPPGVPVGTVKDSGNSKDGEKYFLLLPCENLTAVRFVFIVQKKPDFPVKEYMVRKDMKKLGIIGWYTVFRREK